MTSFDASKRRLFRRVVSGGRPDQALSCVRPPWSVDEYDFVAGCSGCGDCIRACPQAILKADPRHQVYLDFSQGECTLCGECVLACQQALFDQSQGRSPWQHQIIINQNCLAEKSVFCRSCGEVCEVRAIGFSLHHQSIPAPEVNLEACNGCGACLSICPTEAIQIQFKSNRRVASL